VNVVSKASLAMLNPAHAMGIEAGPSWYEEKQRLAAGASPSPTISPSGSFAIDSPWAMESTPELEAFTSQEQESEKGGLGLILGAPAMQRKISSESVFEDDEPAYRRRPTINPSSAGSSTLSRLFTRKKPTPKGKPSGPSTPQMSWDVPHSAPPHMLSFDLSSPADTNSSLPRTPADAFITPLPTSISAPLTSGILKPPMSRKSSMPTLRDIRKATGSPLTVDIPLSHLDAADSFYWRSESPITPTLFTPSSSTSSNLSSKSFTATRSNSRISSMGRGAARKSSMESVPTILIRAPKIKQQQRYDPWDSQNMPPMPSHPSVASLIAEEKREEQKASLSTRRRSRSVDALPSGFYTGRGPIERSDSSQSQVSQAIRRSHGAVVGTASPKLLAKMSPAFLNIQSPERNSNLLKVVESPVVVNIMPPTPDLSSIEQETFEGAAASPSVRRSRSETEIAALIEGQQASNSMHWQREEQEEEDSDEETFLPYATGERFDDRSDSSSVNESPISVASRATSFDEDDAFGFARSMSTMSLSSDTSVDSDMSEEGSASVEDAKILSASSTMSSFSRALLVSPRLGGEFSGWSSQGGSSSSSEISSLASSTFSPSPPSATSKSSKRSSKRLSGMPSLSSGQSLASLMTISSSILDYGAEYIFPNDQTSNLSSPVELQGQMDGEDCLTPRLSDGFHSTNTTKPLVVRKNNQQKTQSDYHNGVLSPISPRPYPRAHNATSPHLELDLSLPLDLHEIGLGFITDEVPKRRGGDKPRVPSKSRARHTNAAEPKTPPTTTRRLSNIIKQERDNETFGLGLGLGLESAFNQSTVNKSSASSVGLAL
jgi:hypothetical protein